MSAEKPAPQPEKIVDAPVIDIEAHSAAHAAKVDQLATDASKDNPQSAAQIEALAAQTKLNLDAAKQKAKGDGQNITLDTQKKLSA